MGVKNDAQKDDTQNSIMDDVTVNHLTDGGSNGTSTAEAHQSRREDGRELEKKRKEKFGPPP